jgi:hypothetical protein
MQVSYIAGGKYCRRCEYYFFTERLFCECCGMRLRANPHRGRVYKEKVRAKKHELIDHKEFVKEEVPYNAPVLCFYYLTSQGIAKKDIAYLARSNYSTFTLSLYCTDQNFENKLNQDLFISVIFLKYSAYIRLKVLT